MSDRTKIWLEQLYDSEIKEIEGEIANERCFIKGSYRTMDIIMHEENIAHLEEFLDKLNELKAEVE